VERLPIRMLNEDLYECLMFDEDMHADNKEGNMWSRDVIWISACLNLVSATLSLLNPFQCFSISPIYQNRGDQVKLKKPSKADPSVQEEFQYM